MSGKKTPIPYAAAAAVAIGPLTGYLVVTRLSAKGDAEVTEEPEAPPELSAYVFKPILVNLRNTRGTRYLKAAITLEISGDALTRELEAHLPRVVDYLIGKLSSCELAEIDSPAGRAKLKREIVSGLNDMLATGSVLNLYFTEFVIQ